jgi:hypothetical protein
MEKDVLTETAIEALKLSLRGELLMPDCAGYDKARAICNAMIDRQPVLFARWTCGLASKARQSS